MYFDLGLNKDILTRVGFEPTTSGLMYWHSTTEQSSPLLAVSLFCQYLCSGIGGASQKTYN